MHMKRSFAAAVLAIACFAVSAQAIVLTTPTWTENFDSMGTTGLTTPTGWYTGVLNNNETLGYSSKVQGPMLTTTALLQATTGGRTTNGAYNVGASGSTERCLSTLAGGNVDRAIDVMFTNALAAPIDMIVINYNGEEWGVRDPGGLNHMAMYYSATGLAESWVLMPVQFGYDTPITTYIANGSTQKVDGNTAGRVNNVGGTYVLPATVGIGSSFYLRWYDKDDGNLGANNDMLGIDDFSITATPEPASLSLLAVGGLLGLRRKN
jgi:hypothetical protein